MFWFLLGIFLSFLAGMIITLIGFGYLIGLARGTEDLLLLIDEELDNYLCIIGLRRGNRLEILYKDPNTKIASIPKFFGLTDEDLEEMR